MKLMIPTALLIAALPLARAEAECAGDCNGDNEVAINEVITCVNIGLGTLSLEQCSACDVNGDSMVAINEIITSVNIGLGLLPCAAEEVICGDEVTDGGEDCDDGNNFGGDGCAANCTFETRREGELTEASEAIVKGVALPLTLPLRGSQALTTGRPRDVDVIDVDGNVVARAGEVPIVIKADDVKFEPVSLFGIVCACVRGIPQDEAFGEGNSGSGSLGCTEDGLQDIDYLTEQDHNTTPGDPGNSGTQEGLPDDPECDDTTEQDGIVSTACVEGTGEACSAPTFEHIGVCNSPRVLTRSGGSAGRGATYILNSTAIGLLSDGGACMEIRNQDGSCRFPDYGEDCQPCTDDDPDKGTVNVQPTTSGTANVVIYDTNDEAGQILMPSQPVTGELSDCSVFDRPGDASLAGTLVTAFPGLDTEQIGDAVTTSVLQAR